jgi:hypothetical protein
MRRVRVIPSVAVCALALVVATPDVHAATTILKEKVKGQQMVADFGSDTLIDCGDEFGTQGNFHVGITVLANELVQRSDFFPQELAQIDVFLFTRNSCTGEQGFGNGVILNPDFHWSSTVRADMAGSVAIFDFFTGAPMGTVAFDLLFTGVGPTFRSQSHQVLEFPPIRLLLHSVGAFRSATVSGTITLDGQEFLGGIGSASLGKSRSGAIQMTRD